MVAGGRSDSEDLRIRRESICILEGCQKRVSQIALIRNESSGTLPGCNHFRFYRRSALRSDLRLPSGNPPS
jgi:hypothetical protein